MAEGSKNDRSRTAEFLASRTGKALTGAGFTAASLLALRKIVGSRAISRSGLGSKLLANLKNRDIATSSGLAGAFGAGFANYDRNDYAKHLAAKLRAGDKDFTKTEKRFLSKHMDLRTTPENKRKKGFSDVYWSPAKWGATSAGLSGLGALLGSKTKKVTTPEGVKSVSRFALTPKAVVPAALTSLPTMVGETAIRRAVHAKALASRLSSGKDLFPEEKKLLQTIKRLRQEKARNA
tara:strand:- start:7309 stop:8016 length:708 start_codon:yes stop_codon:yes gene_type:complete